MNDANQPSSTRMFALAILLSTAGLTCLLFISAFVFFQPDQLSLSDQYFPSSTATLTPTHTPTPTITLTPTNTSTPTITPTQTPDPKTATAQAFQSSAASNQWPIILSDGFEDNRNEWLVGNFDDTLAKDLRDITEGKYHWDTTSSDTFIKWSRAVAEPSSDLYLSADVRQVDGSNSTDFGLIFREDPDSSFYYFSINNDQQYSLYLRGKDGWKSIIDSTFTSAIVPWQSNRLAVLAEGDHIILFVNAQYIADVHDDSIPAGTTAFAIEMFNANEQARFEFDNFELREP